MKSKLFVKAWKCSLLTENDVFFVVDLDIQWETAMNVLVGMVLLKTKPKDSLSILSKNFLRTTGHKLAILAGTVLHTVLMVVSQATTVHC